MTARFVGGKVFGSVATLAFVLIFNFFLFRIVEPHPVDTLFRGRNLTDEKRAELTAQFGLDKPLPVQFVRYLQQTAVLNLGDSYQSRQPVSEEIAAKIWPTVALVGISTALTTVIGVALGFRAAWKKDSATDYVVTTSTLAFYAMPEFWLGMLLLAGFAVALNWFPVGGIINPRSSATGLAKVAEQLHHMALPGITLTLAYLGEYAIVARSALLEVKGEDYLLVARAKGLRDKMVRKRHAIPNARLPVVTLIAINFGFVLSGAIAIETLFSWPGLGKLTYDSINGPDLPMLQGLFLLFSAAVIAANLVADLLYAWLDPRVRT